MAGKPESRGLKVHFLLCLCARPLIMEIAGGQFQLATVNSASFHPAPAAPSIFNWVDKNRVENVHYYPFHIADFALHTSHLTLEEEAVFRRLLDYYYDTESPIPKETQPVIRRLRLGSYEETVASILSEFFVLQHDGWHNLRADSEINDYNKKAEIARENGKKGGRPKKHKALNGKNPEKPSGLFIGTQKKANQNQEPITSNDKPETNKDLNFSSWPEKPSEQVWKDWKQHRTKKKATINQTVINRMAPELQKAHQAGFSVDDCLSVQIEAGWQGFKCDWLLNREKGNAGAKQDSNQDFISMATSRDWAN